MFTRRLFFSLAMLGLLAVPASAVIMLDVGSGPTMAGWTKVERVNDFAHSTPINLGDGVQAGFDNTFSVTTYDRSTIATSPLHALGLDDLLRDFVTLGGGTPPGGRLQIKALAAGDYSVTLYAADVNYTTEIDKFAINGSSPIAVGPFGANPTVSLVSTTVAVTVDTTGMIEITRSGTGSAKLCGVVVEAVPEPVSLVLLLAGGGLVVVRRRR